MQIKLNSYLQNNASITMCAMLYLVRGGKINRLLLTQALEDGVIEYQIPCGMVR